MDIQPRYLLPRFIRPRVPASCFIRTVNRTSLADIREYKRIYACLSELPSGMARGRRGHVGRARKQNFVLFGDTISCKFAFYCLDLSDRERSILNYKHRWIEVACLFVRRITWMEQWPPQKYSSFLSGGRSSRWTDDSAPLNRQWSTLSLRLRNRFLRVDAIDEGFQLFGFGWLSGKESKGTAFRRDWKTISALSNFKLRSIAVG